MIVSDAGYRFILRWEGYVPYLYDDGGQKGVGNATVAIGILVHPGPYHELRGRCIECDKWPRQSDPKAQWISEARAIALLRDKANATGVFAGGQDYAGAVRRAFPDATQNQFDAMVDFAYNLGSGAVPAVARAYYDGGFIGLRVELLKYVNPPWAREALTRRRHAEYALFSGPATPPATEEEPAMKRHNVESSSPFIVGRTFPVGSYLVNVDLDYPTNPIPVGAHCLRVEPFIAGAGRLVLRDASKAYAGQVSGPARTVQRDVFIGPINEPPLNGARGFRFVVEESAVTIEQLGIVGWSA